MVGSGPITTIRNLSGNGISAAATRGSIVVFEAEEVEPVRPCPEEGPP
jgi:hypothetical protein